MLLIVMVVAGCLFVAMTGIILFSVYEDIPKANPIYFVVAVIAMWVAIITAIILLGWVYGILYFLGLIAICVITAILIVICNKYKHN